MKMLADDVMRRHLYEYPPTGAAPAMQYGYPPPMLMHPQHLGVPPHLMFGSVNPQKVKKTWGQRLRFIKSRDKARKNRDSVPPGSISKGGNNIVPPRQGYGTISQHEGGSTLAQSMRYADQWLYSANATVRMTSSSTVMTSYGTTVVRQHNHPVRPSLNAFMNTNPWDTYLSSMNGPRPHVEEGSCCPQCGALSDINATLTSKRPKCRKCGFSSNSFIGGTLRKQNGNMNKNRKTLELQYTSDNKPSWCNNLIPAYHPVPPPRMKQIEPAFVQPVIVQSDSATEEESPSTSSESSDSESQQNLSRKSILECDVTAYELIGRYLKPDKRRKQSISDESDDVPDNDLDLNGSSGGSVRIGGQGICVSSAIHHAPTAPESPIRSNIKKDVINTDFVSSEEDLSSSGTTSPAEDTIKMKRDSIEDFKCVRIIVNSIDTQPQLESSTIKSILKKSDAIPISSSNSDTDSDLYFPPIPDSKRRKKQVQFNVLDDEKVSDSEIIDDNNSNISSNATTVTVRVGQDENKIENVEKLDYEPIEHVNYKPVEKSISRVCISRNEDNNVVASSEFSQTMPSSVLPDKYKVANEETKLLVKSMPEFHVSTLPSAPKNKKSLLFNDTTRIRLQQQPRVSAADVFNSSITRHQSRIPRKTEDGGSKRNTSLRRPGISCSMRVTSPTRPKEPPPPPPAPTPPPRRFFPATREELEQGEVKGQMVSVISVNFVDNDTNRHSPSPPPLPSSPPPSIATNETNFIIIPHTTSNSTNEYDIPESIIEIKTNHTTSPKIERKEEGKCDILIKNDIETVANKSNKQPSQFFVSTWSGTLSNSKPVAKVDLNKTPRSRFYISMTASRNNQDSQQYDLFKDHIYEEIPDIPLYDDASVVQIIDKDSPRKSMFEGASRKDILSFLEGLRYRALDLEEGRLSDGETSLPEDIDDVGEMGPSSVNSLRRNQGPRVSHMSSVSDSSEDSTLLMGDALSSLKQRSSAEVERNDSGVGSETSKPPRRRRPSRPESSSSSIGASPTGKEDHICEDCDQIVETIVDESGVDFEPLVCRKCAKRRCERKEIITEIVETELKYGRDLKIILDEFYRPMLVAGLLTAEQLSSIFLNVQDLSDSNAKFTERLKDAIEIALEQGDEDLTTVNIGRLFLEASCMLHTFEAYCTRQGAASLLLAQLEKDKELLRIFLRVSQMENAVLRRMNLSSFLMVPVQRVTKYPLLLDRLLKVTLAHHEGREALKEAQQKISHHLERMNAEAKDLTTTKLWRRISIMNSPYKRFLGDGTDVQGNLRLRKMVLNALDWSGEEDVRFVMEGKLLVVQSPEAHWRRGRSVRLSPAHAIFVTLGRPTEEYRPPEEGDDLPLVFSKNTGIREASLLLVKEKGTRLSLIREPLSLERCIFCCEPEWEDFFEVQEIVSKETVMIKAEDKLMTDRWYRQLQYHSQSLGVWRRRRPALANIMINGLGRR